MAHVGVLKVLEEVGLQPDYITGTSMGSIMGGLYSIGYDSEDLSKLIETVDWSKLLTNEIPSDKVIMRRKYQYNRYILEMPFYQGRPQLPAGLIEGQKLSALFSELTWPQAGVDDFNDFPYPFACIGTDILSGQKVLLNSGDLSSAMRSSMAIPSVFTAVERDSNLLVDGGVVRNFPVEEAIDMGADIVIGVYVGFDQNMTADQLRSLTSVITRTSLLSGAHDVESQIPLVDYFIVPDLAGYSPADFTSGIEIMNRGEEAARAQIDQLRALADSINALAPPPGVKMLPDNDSILVSDIHVLTDDNEIADFIIDKSEIAIGEYLHPGTLNESIDKVVGTLFFYKLEYYFEKMDEGYCLVFRPKEFTPSTIRAAMHYDNTFGPGLILNYTLLNSLIHGSRLSLSTDISEAPIVDLYYDVHLGKKRNFMGSLFFRGERERLPYYQDGLDMGDFKHSVFHSGFGVRQILATNNQLGAELYWRYSNLALTKSLRQALANAEDFELFLYLQNFIYKGPELSVFYQHNSYESYLYPTRGSDFFIRYRQAYNTRYITEFDIPDSIDVETDRLESTMDPYWRLEINGENFAPIGSYMSVNTLLAAGFSHQGPDFEENREDFVNAYYIGGYGHSLRAAQVPFIGLNDHELLFNNYALAKFGLQFRPMDNLFISVLTNVLFVSDSRREFFDEIRNNTDESGYLGIGGGFSLKTPLGPISVYLGSLTREWRPIFYTNIGFTLW